MKARGSVSAGLAAVATMVLLSCGNQAKERPVAAPSHNRADIVDTCENPDAAPACCFRDIPSDPTPVMTIAGDSEPGARLEITGTIYSDDGRTPYPGVALYAYHTDTTGRYIPDADDRGVQRFHGRLHGWCTTGPDGRYTIRTIRPTRYPQSTTPAHIHVWVMEPGGGIPYYVNDIVFADDKFVNERYRAMAERGIGGDGIVALTAGEDGVLRGVRDMKLMR